MIRIHLDAPSCMAGDFLTGRVTWSAEDDRPPRRIVVATLWETNGTGNAARGVTRALQMSPARDHRETTIPFRFLIPHEGPISYQGELTGIVWKLRVRVDLRGFDQFEESEFRVVPRHTRIHEGAERT